MQKSELREWFLSACNDIAQPFLEMGFKVTAKGQCLKRKSPNKDFTCEIYFQSRTYNHSGSITVYPCLTVYSQKAKAYDLEHTGNPHCRGVVWVSDLGKLTPQNFSTVWNVAGDNRNASVREIINAILQYGLPIFKLFDNPKDAVKTLCETGTLFYEHMVKGGDSLRALTFMLLYGTREEAERYFNGYIRRCGYREKICASFAALENVEMIDLNSSDFWQDNFVKQAYTVGLTIWEE